MNIGVLPVQVSEGFLEKIFKSIEQDSKSEFEVNLNDQSIRILKTGETEIFDINDYKKDNLLNGFDDIDYLLNIKEDIEAFSKKSPL